MLELALQSITRDAGIEHLLSGQIDGSFEMLREQLLLAMAQGHAFASRTSVSLFAVDTDMA
jgi:hypothetical protein